MRRGKNTTHNLSLFGIFLRWCAEKKSAIGVLSYEIGGNEVIVSPFAGVIGSRAASLDVWHPVRRVITDFSLTAVYLFHKPSKSILSIFVTYPFYLRHRRVHGPIF